MGRDKPTDQENIPQLLPRKQAQAMELQIDDQPKFNHPKMEWVSNCWWADKTEQI